MNLFYTYIFSLKKSVSVNRHFFFLPFSLVVGLALAGCTAVGPDYVRSNPEMPSSWHAAQDPAVVLGSAIVQNWWTVFNDPMLTRLIQLVSQGAPRHSADPAKDGSSMLAIFLYQAEAQRLGIPSCMQYRLDAHASRLLTSMHEQNQLGLAASFVQLREPAWLSEA